MSFRFCRLVVVLASLVALAAAAPTPPAWPAVDRDARPWTRWWWFGGIGDRASLTAEMEKYAAAGLGGLEITPIYGVRGAEERFTPFLSPAWMDHFEHALAEGRRLNLGLDLATGTGWPFGGPWIEGDEACRYLAHRIIKVTGGARVAEPVTFRQKPLLRAVNAPAGTARRGGETLRLGDLREPIAANADLQSLALDQVRFEKNLPLAALIAHSAAGEVLDLTAAVGADGVLDWTAPAGDWTLYALFSGWHGKMVERAGPGGEGNVIDHFSSTALENYLTTFDAAFAGRDLRGLRAFFNDSYEVDDASGESDWTPRFLDEFARRRGYELTRHLPELFGDSPESRVVSDYRETISDLLRDEFTTPWREWAHGHRAIVRNQAHGSPANLLDLYAASDIPEQEGTDLLAIKLASSAAHVAGKPLASAEAATWLNEHFLTTLGELKADADNYLLAGINHLCYHGTPFSPPGEPWPGYNFYAAVELSTTNPLWTDFPALNAYVTRAQSFLQSGQPDEDLLVYYNIHDRWAQRGDGTLPHFHGRTSEGVGARITAEQLHRAGYGVDYISDRLLAGVTWSEGRLVSSGQSRYRAIVVPATQRMPLPTFRHLLALAEHGALVLFEQDLPSDVPGYGDLAARQAELAGLREKLSAQAVVRDGVTQISWGRGRIVVGPNLVAAAGTVAGLSPETLGTHGLEFVRRRDASGAFYFIANRTARAVDDWIDVQTPGKSAAIFDPMTGRSGQAAFRTGNGQPGSVYLQLAPGETRIVRILPEALPDAPWVYGRPAGEPVALAGDWSIMFSAGGPVLPARVTTGSLRSWTELAGEAGEAFAGTAVYQLRLARPVGTAAWHQLDLGAVAESARISLNGRVLGTVLQAPWSVLIPADLWQEENVLEVQVTNLAANRIAAMDRQGMPWKIFYNVNMPARRRDNAGSDGLFTAAHWKPRPSGLLGPVTLTAVASFAPAGGKSD